MRLSWLPAAIPYIPNIPGMRDARPWTNREATSAEQSPKRLAVIGGGPVACEMAQALHSLGAAETTMLVARERLLPKTEPFAGDLVAKSFRDIGFDVRFGRFATNVERPVPAGPVTIQVDDGSQLEADELLVGTGREPVVHNIGLETIDIEADGSIDVDPTMRATGVPDGWLYAIGDVNGRNQLTHMGKYQARVCGDVIVARAKGLPDDAPACTISQTTSALRRQFSPTRRSSPSGAPRRKLTRTASRFARSSTTWPR